MAPTLPGTLDEGANAPKSDDAQASKGGLLVDIDRCSLKVAIEPIGSISRRAVSLAFRRMQKRGAIGTALKTATTDNGCEVSHQKNLERILGCPVYYTRACASYEKGAVENEKIAFSFLQILKGEQNVL